MRSSADELLATVRCDEPAGWANGRGVGPTLNRRSNRARGGTVVLERFGDLDAERRNQAAHILRDRGADALLLAMSNKDLGEGALDSRPATSIRIKPLHEREEDIWELVDHFYMALVEEQAVPGGIETCEGFSRQAKSDLAEAVRETSLASVRRLRDVVRDVVFETLSQRRPAVEADERARAPLPRAHLRPDRRWTSPPGRGAALVASQLEQAED